MMRKTKRLLAAVTGLTVMVGAVGAQAQEWHPISRSAHRVYLADVGTLGVVDDVTTVRVARVSRKPASATHYGHSVEEYVYRCATNEVRPGVSIEYGEDGEEADRFEDGGDWETVRPDTMDAYVKAVACDGERSNPPVWPTIRAFMDAGRGG